MWGTEPGPGVTRPSPLGLSLCAGVRAGNEGISTSTSFCAPSSSCYFVRQTHSVHSSPMICWKLLAQPHLFVLQVWAGRERSLCGSPHQPRFLGGASPLVLPSPPRELRSVQLLWPPAPGFLKSTAFLAPLRRSHSLTAPVPSTYPEESVLLWNGNSGVFLRGLVWRFSERICVKHSGLPEVQY